jgi:crotonobetainyl-CoA:carnitine CoA-transferase CaiB-like acyl-CoA transferase
MSLFVGVLGWLSHDWYSFAEQNVTNEGATPKDAHPLVFRCADGKFIHFVLGAANSRRHVFTILGVENPIPSLDEDPRGFAIRANGVRNYYGDIDKLQSYIGNWNRQDLLEALWEKGVPAEAVNGPGEGWDDPQTVYNGIIKSEPDGFQRVGAPIRVAFSPGATPDVVQVACTASPPLRGFRVVDFGTFTAGPHASLLLRDLGADVIKVEQLSGDPLRHFQTKYVASNRGKRVISIDLKAAEGLEIALKLCRSADFVHHNFRPGVAERLGIGAEAVHGLRSELIVLQNSAYGDSGPKTSRGGFDMMFQAFAGHEVREAGRDNPPENYRLPIVDLTTGILGALASMACLYQRLRYGARRHKICGNLLNSSLFLISELIRSPGGNFEELPVLDYQRTGFSPSEKLYATGDGWIAISARDDAMAKRLVTVLGLQGRIERFRNEWGHGEVALIEEQVASWTSANLLEKLKENRVWSARCIRTAMVDTLTDPQLLAEGATVRTLDASAGQVTQLGAMFLFSRSPTVPSGEWPSMGQHTIEILAETGYSATEIEALLAKKVVA